MTGARIVALIGPRAAGKTTLGRALAEHLGWGFVDTDERLAERVGATASDYLRDRGEAAFRAVEVETVDEVWAAPGPQVVALGGGAILSQPVRDALAQPSVFVVMLRAEIDQLVARQERDPRTPLTDLSLIEEVREVWRVRRPLYEQAAHLQISTNSANVDACIAAILDKMPSTP